MPIITILFHKIKLIPKKNKIYCKTLTKLISKNIDQIRWMGGMRGRRGRKRGNKNKHQTEGLRWSELSKKVAAGQRGWFEHWWALVLFWDQNYIIRTIGFYFFSLNPYVILKITLWTWRELFSKNKINEHKKKKKKKKKVKEKS